MDKIDKLEKLDISYLEPIFKEYREKAERTQEEVAEKVGITVHFLMALENENRRPSIDVLLRLADTLNIPGDVLLHPQLQTIDSEDDQLIRMIMRLNSRDKKGSSRRHPDDAGRSRITLISEPFSSLWS